MIMTPHLPMLTGRAVLALLAVRRRQDRTVPTDLRPHRMILDARARSSRLYRQELLGTPQSHGGIGWRYDA